METLVNESDTRYRDSGAQVPVYDSIRASFLTREISQLRIVNSLKWLIVVFTALQELVIS
jgi:hypothetical protein